MNKLISQYISIYVACFAGLRKAKKYDWKDSNLALFGSDTEKNVKSKWICSNINKMLEMTSRSLINAGKHCTSNVAWVHSQPCTKDSVFWLAQMVLCLMTLHYFPAFVGPNVISDAISALQERFLKNLSFDIMSLLWILIQRMRVMIVRWQSDLHVVNTKESLLPVCDKPYLTTKRKVQQGEEIEVLWNCAL